MSRMEREERRSCVVKPGPEVLDTAAKSSESSTNKSLTQSSSTLVHKPYVTMNICVICEAAVPAGELDTHAASHNMVCHICGKDDVSINEDYAKHGESHVGANFTCEFEECGYQTGNQRDLWQHANAKHFEISPWICLSCGNSFQTSSMLTIHTKCHHRPCNEIED